MSVLDDVELHLIDGPDQVGAFRRWLGERRPKNAIAWDTETTGLDVFKDTVRLHQFGDGKHGWAFGAEEWGGLARWFFESWDGDIIVHNAPFDIPITEHTHPRIKIPRQRIRDTLIQSRVVEPHMSAALKTQTSRHVDAAAAGLQLNLGATGFDWATVPVEFPQYWQYGALDAVLTWHLDDVHMPVIERECPEAYALEMAVLWVVEKMRRYGAYVDRAWVQRYHDRFLAYCAEVERWCWDQYRVKPGSNQSVIKVLEEAGWRFTKATKAGAKALDADVLEGIDHPLAQAVLGRRQAQKMASTYLRFYLERSDANGLIHPSFSTLGARTSRMSCSDPNLQNLPRLGTSRFGDVVRSSITSRFIGADDLIRFDDTPFTVADAERYGALLFADYAQIEMRLLAHLANEPAMIAAFHDRGTDFFVSLARQIFQDERIAKKDPRRQITKNAGYATVYGAGIRKFAQTAGIPESQAREFMQLWQAMYPNVRALQDAVVREGLRHYDEEGLAYVRSPFTNRRYVSDVNKAYALVNYEIQGGAAELNKMKLVELDSAGLAEWMFATVHDEVMLDVPPEHAADAVRTMMSIMNDDTLLSVPVEATASFGHRWGAKRDWEAVS